MKTLYAKAASRGKADASRASVQQRGTPASLGSTPICTASTRSRTRRPRFRAHKLSDHTTRASFGYRARRHPGRPPIDSSGTLIFNSPGDAQPLIFIDVNELGAELANECGVSLCLTQKLLADAEASAKLPVAGSTDPLAVANIANATASGKLRDLIRNIVESDTFLRAK